MFWLFRHSQNSFKSRLQRIKALGLFIEKQSLICKANLVIIPGLSGLAVLLEKAQELPFGFDYNVPHKAKMGFCAMTKIVMTISASHS